MDDDFLVLVCSVLLLVTLGRLLELLLPNSLSTVLVQIFERDIEDVLVPGGRETIKTFLDVLQADGLAHISNMRNSESPMEWT